MLELRHITKDFPGVRALADLSLRFEPGEIHAVLGENGAGKSTLIRIVCGVYRDYEGEVALNGDVLELSSYQDALDHGISMVNQEIQIIPGASVAENILLDQLPRYRTGFGWIDWKTLRRDASAFMDKVGLSCDPRTAIGPLSAAQKQLVQIAKALSAESSVLLLDEPTSSITRHEAETLFGILNGLREEGKTIIFVSHKLEEIFRLCDRVSVIRDGELIGTDDIAKTDRDRIVEMMIGREIADEDLGRLSPDYSSVVLEARGLLRTGVVEDVSFSLHRGEILGFYGLVGAGRTETARLIIGEDRAEEGTVFVNGEEAEIRNVSDALYRYGIGYVSENRKEEGLWLDFDVETNMTVTVWPRLVNMFTRSIASGPQREIALDLVRDMQIRTPGLDQRVANLSGGNQQKVSIAKWLAAQCEILIIDEPTVGVDVGAKEYIHRLIWKLANEEGKSIILISSDLPEIIKVARRILVFKSGSVVGELTDVTGNPADAERVGRQIGQLLV